MDRWTDHDRVMFRWLVLPVAYTAGPLTIVLLWRWFVAPLGVPRIGYGHALGLDVLLNLLIPTASGAAVSARWKTWHDGAGHVWGAIIFALAVGGAARLAMGAGL